MMNDGLAPAVPPAWKVPLMNTAFLPHVLSSSFQSRCLGEAALRALPQARPSPLPALRTTFDFQGLLGLTGILE